MFAIDIDGTIARLHVQRYAQVCNERLHLGIEEKRLETISYSEFLQLPELIRHQERVGEQQYRRNLDWMALEPDALLAAKPMPDALTGLRTLAQQGTLAYYTARFSTILPERNEPMAHATFQWLAMQEFPNPNSVVFCMNAADKLRRLALLSEQQYPLVLIDDRASYVLEALDQLPEHQEKLYRHLILVAFGTETVPSTHHCLRVLPLPSWKRIDGLLDQFVYAHVSS